MQNSIPDFTPLTGIFTGTANSDTYRKALSIFGLSPDLDPDIALNGAISSTLNIRSFAGDDTVDIDASVTGKDISAVGLLGLEYGDINTGADNDTVLIRGLINSSSSTTIPVAFFQGIRGSTLLTGTGEDTVVVSSTVTLDNSTNFQTQGPIALVCIPQTWIRGLIMTVWPLRVWPLPPGKVRQQG